jgi:PIH1 CS-like domain
MKYKGKSVEIQRVRGKKQPKIEVQEDKPLSAEEERAILNNSKGSGLPTKGMVPSRPQFKLFVKDYGSEEFVEFDGVNLSYDETVAILLVFELPLLVTGKFCELQVASDELALNNGSLYQAFLKLPVNIKRESCCAWFNPKDRKLRVMADVQKPRGIDESFEEELTLGEERNGMNLREKKEWIEKANISIQDTQEMLSELF